MAATRLSIYNGALRLLSERRLASLSENREPRRLLDDAWGDGQTNGAVKYCLERGQWKFATRTVQADYSPSIEPPFGFRYAFDQPVDMVQVAGIYEDSGCRMPLLRYSDERQYWYADLPTIYVSYISNDASYGADLSLWPATFEKVIEAYLAMEVAGNLTQGENKQIKAERNFERAVAQARSSDAMRSPTKFTPPGSWSQARHGYGSGRNNRWSGETL